MEFIMLVLSRKEGESITLIMPNGENICIVLTEYAGKQTKVGIDAPPSVQILRSELVEERLLS